MRLNEAVAANERTGQAYCILQWTSLYLGNRLQLNLRRRTSSYTTKEVTDRSGQFAFGDVRLTANDRAINGLSVVPDNDHRSNETLTDNRLLESRARPEAP